MTAKRFVAYLKYFGWQFVVKGTLGVVVISIISDGMRLLIPDVGKKLYKLPFLEFMKDYEGWHKLDCAHLYALVLMLAVFLSWGFVIRSWLQIDSGQPHRWNQKVFGLIASVLAFGAILLDGFLFYRAEVAEDWGSDTISLPCLAATALYVILQVFVAFVSVVLKEEVKALSPKENDDDNASDRFAAPDSGPDAGSGGLRTAPRVVSDVRLVRDAGREGR
jgi:hypothetical protein